MKAVSTWRPAPKKGHTELNATKLNAGVKARYLELKTQNPYLFHVAVWLIVFRV